jgi:hypothetical protein
VESLQRSRVPGEDMALVVPGDQLIAVGTEGQIHDELQRLAGCNLQRERSLFPA